MLRFFTQQDYLQIAKYEISSEQLTYTRSPQLSINDCVSDKERFPILMFKETTLVTYFVLHKGIGIKEYSENKNAILLRSFSTDHRFMGKGYAKKALQLLPSFIQEHFPLIDEIVLAVNETNTIAQSLYQKYGFKDQGKRLKGRNSPLIIMHYALKKPL